MLSFGTVVGGVERCLENAGDPLWVSSMVIDGSLPSKEQIAPVVEGRDPVELGCWP